MEKFFFIKQNILLYYVIYPIAAKLTPFLAKTRIIPTHITLLWLTIITIAACLAFSGWSAHIILTLFFCAYCFDCLDGQYARDPGLTSDLGKFLDDFGGDIFNVFFWLSLGVIASETSPTNLFGESELSILLCFIILFRSALVLRTNTIIFTNSAEISEETRSYLKFLSFKRIARMPLEFGEFLWPVTIVAYMVDGLFWLILYACAYSAAVLIVTLRNSIRKIVAAEKITLVKRAY